MIQEPEVSPAESDAAMADLSQLAHLLPPELDPVCDAAVDTLEIAAALETAGISNRVAQTTFGRPDLFTLAEELYGARPRRFVPVLERSTAPRPGGMEDLALGLLFVVPVVSLAAAARVVHLVLPWWALPLAVTVGWAFGQALAGSALALRNRGQDPGPAVLPSLTLAGAVGGSAALVGVVASSGGPRAVMTVTMFCLYVTSLAVLSVYEEVAFIAVTLAPSLFFAVGYLVEPSSRFLRVSVVIAVVVTVLVALALALRHARAAWWSPLRLGSHERNSVRTFFLYGICCGLAVSAVTVAAQGSKGLGPLSLVALPVMLSLGVLEWQLHTYRAKATGALRASTSLAGFERRAARHFARSTVCYVAALLCVSAAVAFLPVGAGHRLPLLSLAAEDTVGVTLFAGMVVSMCSALDRGVRSWLGGGAAFGLAVAVVHVVGLGADRTALQAASLAGAMVAMVSMIVGALGVLRLPFHYHR